MSNLVVSHKMERVENYLNTIKFNFEDYVTNVLKIDLSRNKLKQDLGLCRFFIKGTCHKGQSCPFRHSRPEKSIVCKHWLRGLCKKGDSCEFLHEYNLKKMPECWFFTKYGECSNPECLYLHIDPSQKIKECSWYNRGFCRHGPYCRTRHVRAVACQRYLTGFCPYGPNCDFAHPKYDPNLIAEIFQ